jgi:hypothetical protein
MAIPDLPDFRPGEVYVIKGETGIAIMDEIRKNKPIKGYGITLTPQVNGTVIAAEALEGEESEKQFRSVWVLDSEGDPIVVNFVVANKYDTTTNTSA